MTVKPRWNVVSSVVGVVIGGVALYLSLRGIPLADGVAYFRNADLALVLSALGIYAGALCLRSLRWRMLLWSISRLAWRQVVEALLVGYAFNNALPARLGELVRADYLGRRFGLSRSAVLGSIMIERLVDGATVVAGLAIGLALVAPIGSHASARPFYHASLAGALAIGAAGLCAAALGKFGDRIALVLPAAAADMVRGFAVGLRGLNRGVAAGVLLLNLLVWACELAATWVIVKATGIDLAAGQILVVLCAAGLSTLLPSAPGFIGSYQLVFGLSFAFFGASRAAGVAAATLIQVFLFGAVTLVGLSIYFWHHAQKAALSASVALAPREPGAP